jgi:putative ABC transport system permease protein
MWKHYVQLTLRQFARYKAASFINISGLAVGLTACLLIFLYVRNELSYDRHNPNADRIYRINADMTLSGKTERLARSSYNLAPVLKSSYPEVEEVVRVAPAGKQTLWRDEQVYQLEKVFFADAGFFNVFNYDFVEGNPAKALQNPFSIALTDESARLIFGTDRGVTGKSLRFAQNTYTVTAVFQGRTNQSHLPVNALLSMNSRPKALTDQLEADWFYMVQSNYVLLREAAHGKTLQAKLDGLKKQHVTPWLKSEAIEGDLRFIPQPLTDIHLSNEFLYDSASELGNASYLYIFSVVAVLILLIGCINYINLATAQATRRAKEVGIRKSIGGSRGQLFRQFMGESVAVCLLAVGLAVLLTAVLLKPFNMLTGKSFGLDVARDAAFLGFLLLVIVGVSLTAGAYPALVISRFNPVLVLKGDKMPQGGGSLLRQVLVVTQFCISVVLIVGTLLVYSQMQYMRNRSLGFNKEQVLVVKVPVADSTVTGRLQQIRDELLANPRVAGVAGSNVLPGEGTGNLLFYLSQNGKTVQLGRNFLLVDEHFLDLMQIPVVQGRNFSRVFPTDKKEAFILNQAAARSFGWENPLGEKLMNGLGYDGKVVGVIRDFNYQSLHNPIEPLILMLHQGTPQNLLIRIRPENIAETIRFVEKKWKQISTRYPMEYVFLDDSFNRNYVAEEKMLTVFTYFSALTILIACLGLFGLATFTAEQRTKEIGIRKVMGASVGSIVLLLSGDFLKLVALAFVIAVPVAWYAMDRWLQDFAYRVNIGWWVFVLAGTLALLVALLTVSFQSIKAALANPVKSLRNE